MGLFDVLKKELTQGHWEVRRTIWPYKDGWGTYNPVTGTIFHTGLPTKEDAQRAADELNARA